MASVFTTGSQAAPGGLHAGERVASTGKGGASAPRQVNFHSLPKHGAIHAWNHGPLLKSGKFSGSQLPSRPSTGSKTVSRTPLVTPPKALVTNASFDGVSFANSNCSCQPPDTNAAVGPSNIVEMVNLQMAVYDKAGNQQSTAALSSFLGTAGPLSDPRVIYDPTWDRYFMTVIDITAFNATPTLWLAASASSNPNSGWFIYHIGFGGGAFPAGELLDYPVLGMDADAVVVSTNNFAQPSPGNFTYNGSTVWSVSKARIYNGFGFSFRAFGVPFGTAPGIMSGRPTQDLGYLWLMSADDANNVMHVYYMVNTSRSGSTNVIFKGDAPYNFAAPPRQVNQPGTAVTLDPLDGRLVWAPTVFDGLVWFAHGVAIGSFPGVNYGYVNPSALTVTTGTAFHSATSDDFNPSIGVARGPAAFYETLTWAYTDTPNNVPTTDVWAVNINKGALNHQVGKVYSAPGFSTNEFRFGDYSSVSPDYFANGPCGAGQSAVVANQYFAADGTWKTRIASVGAC